MLYSLHQYFDAFISEAVFLQIQMGEAMRIEVHD
jgi:hypothetical protein